VRRCMTTIALRCAGLSADVCRIASSHLITLRIPGQRAAKLHGMMDASKHVSYSHGNRSASIPLHNIFIYYAKRKVARCLVVVCGGKRRGRASYLHHELVDHPVEMLHAITNWSGGQTCAPSPP
jgi:hypothetical protein